jgi:isopropylmalate/homocitrate/citramalate synthase
VRGFLIYYRNKSLHRFSREDKEEILRALILYGVKFVELFSPAVSVRERADWAALRAVRDALITQKGSTVLLAVCFGKFACRWRLNFQMWR